MTGVMSDHNAAPMLPFTVHGCVCPIIGDGCRGRAHAAPSFARGPYASLGRGGKYAQGVGRSRAYVAGVGRDRDCSRQGTRIGRDGNYSLSLG
jgi:hypothetical protein